MKSLELMSLVQEIFQDSPELTGPKIVSDQTYEDLQGSTLASKNNSPWPLCQFPLQVFAQFEFLPWFLSVDCDCKSNKSIPPQIAFCHVVLSQ